MNAGSFVCRREFFISQGSAGASAPAFCISGQTAHIPMRPAPRPKRPASERPRPAHFARMPRVASQVCARRRGRPPSARGSTKILIRRSGGELTRDLALKFAGAWPDPLVTRRGGREDASVSGSVVMSVSQFWGGSPDRSCGLCARNGPKIRCTTPVDLRKCGVFSSSSEQPFIWHQRKTVSPIMTHPTVPTPKVGLSLAPAKNGQARLSRGHAVHREEP